VEDDPDCSRCDAIELTQHGPVIDKRTQWLPRRFETTVVDPIVIAIVLRKVSEEQRLK
jgi:hypothetical protein